MMRPSPEELLEETARLAYHLHWPLDTILDLEHEDRRRFLDSADAIAAETVDAVAVETAARLVSDDELPAEWSSSGLDGSDWRASVGELDADWAPVTPEQ